VRCPRQQQQQQQQRVTEGTAMAPWNGPKNFISRRRNAHHQYVVRSVPAITIFLLQLVPHDRGYPSHPRTTAYARRIKELDDWCGPGGRNIRSGPSLLFPIRFLRRRRGPTNHFPVSAKGRLPPHTSLVLRHKYRDEKIATRRYTAITVCGGFSARSFCHRDVDVTNRCRHDKKFGRCWDSATCEPLDAEIIAAEVQNSTFFPYPSGFLSRIQDHRILRSMSLWHAGSQDTDLSCHVPIYTFCCTVWSQSTSVTDRRTDVMLVA